MEKINEKGCPKCGSVHIKKVEDENDFLPHVEEGDPVRKQINKTKQKYICLERNCGHEWEEDLV